MSKDEKGSLFRSTSHSVTVIHSQQGYTDASIPMVISRIEAGLQIRRRQRFCIDLSDNEIGDEGVSKLMEWLATYKANNCTSLRLYKNKIGDAGARAIGNFLLSDRNYLEELHLSHNAIGVDGVLAILNGVGNAKINDSYVYPRKEPGVSETPLWLRLEHNEAVNREVLDEWQKSLSEARKFSSNYQAICFPAQSCRPHTCSRKPVAVCHLMINNSLRYPERKIGKPVVKGKATTPKKESTPTERSSPPPPPLTSDAMSNLPDHSNDAIKNEENARLDIPPTVDDFENSVVENMPFYILMDASAFLAMVELRNRDVICPVSLPGLLALTHSKVLKSLMQVSDDESCNEAERIVFIVIDYVVHELEEKCLSQMYLKKKVDEAWKTLSSRLRAYSVIEYIGKPTPHVHFRCLPENVEKHLKTSSLSANTIETIKFALLWSQNLTLALHEASEVNGRTFNCVFLTANSNVSEFFKFLEQEKQANDKSFDVDMPDLPCVTVEELNTIISTAFPSVISVLTLPGILRGPVDWSEMTKMASSQPVGGLKSTGMIGNEKATPTTPAAPSTDVLPPSTLPLLTASSLVKVIESYLVSTGQANILKSYRAKEVGVTYLSNGSLRSSLQPTGELGKVVTTPLEPPSLFLLSSKQGEDFSKVIQESSHVTSSPPFHDLPPNGLPHLSASANTLHSGNTLPESLFSFASQPSQSNSLLEPVMRSVSPPSSTLASSSPMGTKSLSNLVPVVGSDMLVMPSEITGVKYDALARQRNVTSGETVHTSRVPTAPPARTPMAITASSIAPSSPETFPKYGDSALSLSVNLPSSMFSAIAPSGTVKTQGEPSYVAPATSKAFLNEMFASSPLPLLPPLPLSHSSSPSYAHATAAGPVAYSTRAAFVPPSLGTGFSDAAWHRSLPEYEQAFYSFNPSTKASSPSLAPLYSPNSQSFTLVNDSVGKLSAQVTLKGSLPPSYPLKEPAVSSSSKEPSVSLSHTPVTTISAASRSARMYDEVIAEEEHSSHQREIPISNYASIELLRNELIEAVAIVKELHYRLWIKEPKEALYSEDCLRRAKEHMRRWTRLLSVPITKDTSSPNETDTI